jgi:hypothetical protein
LGAFRSDQNQKKLVGLSISGWLKRRGGEAPRLLNQGRTMASLFAHYLLLAIVLLLAAARSLAGFGERLA